MKHIENKHSYFYAVRAVIDGCMEKEVFQTVDKLFDQDSILLEKHVDEFHDVVESCVNSQNITRALFVKIAYRSFGLFYKYGNESFRMIGKAADYWAEQIEDPCDIAKHFSSSAESLEEKHIKKNLTVAKEAIKGLFNEEIELYEEGNGIVFQNTVTIPGGDITYDVVVAVKDLFIVTDVRFGCPELVKKEKDELELIKLLNFLNGEDVGRALRYTNETVSASHKIFTPNDEKASVEAVKYALASCICLIENNIPFFILTGASIKPADEAIDMIKEGKS